MSSGSHPKPKRTIGSFLRQKVDGWQSSPSPSTLALSPRPSSPHPSPIDSPSPASRADSVQNSTNQVGAQSQAVVGASLPVPSTNTLNTLGSRYEPPSQVLSSEAGDCSNPDEILVNSSAPISPISHTCREVTGEVWARLGIALRALHKTTRPFPPLQSAIGTFIPCLDVLEEASRNRREYEELAAELTSLAEILAKHMEQSSSMRMSSAIANIARSLKEQAKLVENKRDRGTKKRLMETVKDEDELNKHYHRITSLFRQLQADANLSIWNIVNDQMANTRLDRLKPVIIASHDSTLSGGINRRSCTANTRVAILSELNKWSSNPEGAGVYWMNGMAGTGKTTIASSFSELLEDRKQLAASFFCVRTIPECRQVTRIIPTIAYQLARYSVPFQSILCEVLGEDPDAGSKNMSKQFEQLLKVPLLKVKEAIPSNLVVVIDALDECDDMREVELLLFLLLRSAVELPLRFFVTSRPEPEIYNRMLAHDHGAGNVLHLHDVENSLVQEDIEVYLGEELKSMSPTLVQIKELARRSGNLFIYAATIVRYISPGRRAIDPHTRLESALMITTQPHKMYAEIDKLYTAILKVAFDADNLEDVEIESLQLVLWTAICLQEPVCVDTLAAMTGLNNTQRVMTALDALRSVIHFSEISGLVSTLHASFPDFMFDETRSKAFTCHLAEYSGVLTRRCFDLMKAQLRFNICKLESSFVPDSEIVNLEERVKQAISPPLWYACYYWSDHLQHGVYSDALCVMLSEFLSSRLLFWMEVLNLKQEICTGAEALLKAKLWLKVSIAPAEVARLTEDARNFVICYAANPVAQCTPHIYLSSLPFCPKSSSVFKQYGKKMQGLINITGSAMQRRESSPLATWKIGSPLCSVAYSPDGNCVVVGGTDKTISVLRTHDGTLTTGPLQGHTYSVHSVAYSPDGSRIVSGSSDKTIRVWSAHNGELLAGPFQGHTDTVFSVSFSPNGTHIVSGAGDGTIRVWAAHKGVLVTGPLVGHTNSVMSVKYSPDSSCIASGSRDGTIRAWNANDGTLLTGPFQGHTDSVLSVAYSPDGTRIASGSSDSTIRVWSAHDGVLLAGPFQGHNSSVWSVGYSPDNSRIVSGSLDKTIRVWGAHDGTLVAGPFHGHTDSVLSVAYSPDSSHIVSGSWDGTIRVWSAHGGVLHAGSLEGHPNWVHSVAYSPDGSRIASGSWDGTIRVWSMSDCRLLAGPWKGHTEEVWSVAWSPDGNRIASCSSDGTIRVRSVFNGVLLGGSFKGHTGSVQSIAYSPNGSHIASGSSDSTIRVWYAHNGTQSTSPFQGHTGSVYSVAYSPEGTRIVSGSADKTIRVWSTDGRLLVGPFKGHASLVFSVAFSPDGTRIASGGRDQRVRVWSAHDGKLVAGPCKGHSSSVLSVHYSPDGTRIVSGSVDKTILVWSADDGTSLAGPFQGHTGSVQSVVYSPDSSHIVSGSSDETIRFWSVHPIPVIPSESQGPLDIVCHPNASLTTPHHIHKPNSALARCTIRPDGWVVNSHSQLLFWVPPELAGYLPTTQELHVVYPRGLFQMDHGDLFVGELWHQCYIPE